MTNQTTTGQAHRSADAMGRLAANFDGEILTSSDGARYDEARTVFNAMFDRRPAVIARATTAEDVVAALAFARATGLRVAVRAGGHSVAGYSGIDGGLVIDLTLMKRIDIDPQTRRARVQPGVTAGEFDRAAQAHGLATTGGRMTTTGVAGFTLGSGSGWLERLHGPACDSLMSAQVVTADGRVITASESENPELLWGLRGGGGNFGVVTEFEFALHTVGPKIYGGMLLYPRDRAPEVCRNFRDFFREAPREIHGGAILMTAPPAPFVPPDLQGRPAVAVFAMYFGDLAERPQALSSLHGFGEPAAHLLAGRRADATDTLVVARSSPALARQYVNRLWLACDEALLAGAADALDEAVIPYLESAPFDVALARVAGAQAIGGAQAIAWLRHALDIFTAGGLETDSARTRRLLRTLGGPVPRRRRQPADEALQAQGVTPREAEVLDLVTQGLTNPQIAQRLFLSNRTVQTHVSSLLTKLHADNRAGLIIAAHTLGHTPLRSTESTQPGAGKVGLHASPIDIED